MANIAVKYQSRWLQKPPLGVQINRAHPLARGLVGCWLFNEGGGDKVYDLSGYNNHGTLNGMAFPATTTSGWNPGRDGIGLAFDGTDDYIDCGNDASLNITDAITIEVWVLIAGWNRWMRIVDYFTNDSEQGWFLSRENINNKIEFRLQNIVASSSLVTGTLNIGQWYNIVGVYDKADSIAKIYVDGLEVNSKTPSGTLTYAGVDNLGIGARLQGEGTPPFEYFNGQIDEVRIYNRALSADEIQQLYIEPYCIFEPATKYTVIDERLKSKFVGSNTAAMQLIRGSNL